MISYNYSKFHIYLTQRVKRDIHYFENSNLTWLSIAEAATEGIL